MFSCIQKFRISTIEAAVLPQIFINLFQTSEQIPGEYFDVGHIR
jgi:hypothetical protein